jgi:hypothetical protein
MPALRDPSKRILAVAVGTEQDTERVVLLLDGDMTMVTNREGLNREDVEIYGEGVREGLLAADAEAIDLLERGELDVATSRDDLTPEQAELFEEGVIGGLQIAAQGYWLDPEAGIVDAAVPPRGLLH